MSFDMGFNFRATSGYVTDQAYAVPVLGEAYPHTYTNANGYSINAGWTVSNPNIDNRSNTNDARIAGDNVAYSGGGARTFKADLSSGSAPGAGSYTVDIAAGSQAYAYTSSFSLKDDTTTLITGTATAWGAGHFEDATGSDVTASTNWTGTTVSKTFASTIVNLILNNVDYVAIAHLRLALAGAVTNYVTAACTAVGVATLTKLTSIYKTIALASTGVTTLIKQISPGIKAITATGVATLSESYQTARSLSMASVGTVALGLNISFLISVIAIAIASLSLARIYTRAVSAVAIGVADLATLFSEASAVIFETGKVPIRIVGTWAIGVVRAWRTTAGIGVVPVHTVTDNVAGVVPVFLEASPGIGIVPIDGG